ncbi:hypothetical protein HHK36_019552 [Tetracentron sinense]|uniref:DUF4283 domain-containing protein n=1 Tax=Tetracentron sinense TaxID=13715 RepID=A0A834Z2E1_TETSI|nr:hypothetical protein HHK36_019552 [Tetracentron sinense]
MLVGVGAGGSSFLKGLSVRGGESLAGKSKGGQASVDFDVTGLSSKIPPPPPGWWDLALICVFVKLKESWLQLERIINDFLLVDEQSPHIPLGSSKGLIVVKSLSTVRDLCRCDPWPLPNGGSILINKWWASSNRVPGSHFHYSFWLEIHGIPLHLWKMETFHCVGEICGGLLEVDPRTLSREELEWARIYIKESWLHHIPRVIRLPGRGSSIDLIVKVLHEVAGDKAGVPATPIKPLQSVDSKFEISTTIACESGLLTSVRPLQSVDSKFEIRLSVVRSGEQGIHTPEVGLFVDQDLPPNSKWQRVRRKRQRQCQRAIRNARRKKWSLPNLVVEEDGGSKVAKSGLLDGKVFSGMDASCALVPSLTSGKGGGALEGRMESELPEDLNVEELFNQGYNGGIPRPLVEVFWVQILDIVGDLYGTITLTDPSGHRPSPGQFGLIEWNSTVNAINVPIYENVLGDHGFGSVRVSYIVFSDAVEATVEVTLIIGDEEVPAHVYGSISAGTCNSLEESVLFKKGSDHIDARQLIPLSRSLVAVPLNSVFIVRANLWDYKAISSDVIARGTAEFIAQLSGTFEKCIHVEFDTFMDSILGDLNGNHVRIDVDSLVSKRIEVRLSKLGTVRPFDPLLSYLIDLSEMWKEEEVLVGLSSSSGNSSQTSVVYSWSFRILNGLLFGIGCGALAASIVYVLWSIFVSRRLLVPAEYPVHPVEFAYETMKKPPKMCCFCCIFSLMEGIDT